MSKELKNIIEISFKQLGLKRRNNLPQHLMVENTYNSNLLTDISDVDYTKNNMGPMELGVIEDLPDLICDDLYVYTYLSKEDVVYIGNNIKTTTGSNGAGSELVNRFYGIISKTLTKNLPEGNKQHTQIIDTINLEFENTRSLTITLVEKIEKKLKIREKWEKYTLKKPIGLVLLKIDVSEIPIIELEKNFKEFNNMLNITGCSVYEIDYTKDYYGTLIRDKLEKHLIKKHNYFVQEVEDYYFSDNSIIDNKHSVGNNVISFINYNGEEINRIKLYNKFASNVETSSVRNKFGGHLYDYVYSSNLRLRKLFWEKDVQERGNTRIEISVYGLQNPVSKEIGNNLVEKELTRTKELNQKLFYIQPAKQQWILLAERIQKCFFLVDREEALIYVAWYGNKVTGRVCGVKIDYSRKKDKTDIENLIKWAISDFGFRMVPIYVSEIIEYGKDSIKMSPLRCFVKEENTTTKLVPSKKPGENNRDTMFIDIENFLPETKTIKWEWRTNALPPFDKRKPTYEIIEMSELTKDVQVSLLATVERQKREEELEEAKRNTFWIRRAETILSTEMEKLQYIYESIKRKEQAEKEKEENLDLVTNLFKRLEPKSISNSDVGKYNLLGWKKAKYSSIVLLKNINKEDETYNVIYANTRLEKFLKLFSPYFNETEDLKTKIHFFRSVTTCRDNYFRISIREKTRFFTSGKWIEYYPIFVDENITSKLKTKITEIINEEEKNSSIEDLLLRKIEAPENTKDASRCVDLMEGEYSILAFAQNIFRSKTKTFLYIEELENPKNQYLVSGYWIEEEVRKIEEDRKLSSLPLPVICRLGMFKTTPNKKRARTCSIQFVKEN